ncbi:MAG TPA: hypothetical protein DCP67_10835 [Planctomycetaceae bacterium]|nr:hypothetical protein [Planctomycetaceae bacterium]
MHSMKLHGPWMLYADDKQSEPERIKLPGKLTLGGNPVCAPCTLRRRFGTPTGLTDSDHVILVFHGVTPFAIVSLESQTLGEIASESTIGFDITPFLAGNNYLQLAFKETAEPVGVCEVRIDIADDSEIRTTSYPVINP